jgi:hypothetical protein
LEAGAKFLVFSYGGQIDFAHTLQPAAQILDIGKQIVPRGTILGTLQRSLFQFNVVFLSNIVGEMLYAEPFFGEQ